MRVRILGPVSHVDLAVPDDMGAGELARTAVGYLDEATDVPWIVEHPRYGILSPTDTLADVECRDGQLLHLRSRPGIDEDLPVDDVAGTVGTDVDAAEHWGREWTCRLGSWGLVAWVVAGVGLAHVMQGGAQLPPAAAVAALVLAAMLAAGQSFSTWVLAPIALVLPFVAADAAIAWLPPLPAIGALAVGAAAAAAVAVFVGVLLPALTPLVRPGAVALACLSLCFACWFGVTLLPAPPAAGPALVVVLALVGVARSTSWAMGAAGLARMDDEAVAGAVVTRSSVGGAYERTRAMLTALLAGFATAAAVALTALTGAGPWGVAAALVTAAVLCARGRGYAHPAHVWALVFPPVVGLGVALLWHAVQAPTDVLAPTLLLVAVPAAVLWFGRMRQVGRSATNVWLDRFEKLGLIVLLPLLVGACGVFGTVYARFR